MTGSPYDREARRRADREAQREQKLRTQQLRADIQQLMGLESGRRVVAEFMAQMGVDASPFATNAMQMAHATGKQDAGKWWLNLIRQFCPEKEAIIRAEHDRKPPVKPADEDEDDEH